MLVSKEEDSKVSVNDGQELKRKHLLNFGNAEGLSPNRRSDAEETNKLERSSGKQWLESNGNVTIHQKNNLISVELYS